MSRIKYAIGCLFSQLIFSFFLCAAVWVFSSNMPYIYIYGCAFGIIGGMFAMFLYVLPVKFLLCKTIIILCYILRIIIIFGSVIAAVFISTTLALGVILPYLVSVPIIVLFTILNSKNNGIK